MGLLLGLWLRLKLRLRVSERFWKKNASTLEPPSPTPIQHAVRGLFAPPSHLVRAVNAVRFPSCLPFRDGPASTSKHPAVTLPYSSKERLHASPHARAQNLFWTARALGLPSNATLAEVVDAGHAHCSLPWATLNHGFGGHVPRAFLTRYCFGAAYLVALLHDRRVGGLGVCVRAR